MPTILRVGPYRVFFYSNEGQEPPHVHVEVGDETAKFWLAPVRVAHPGGFSSHELSKVKWIIEEHQSELERAWHDYFGS